MPAPSLTIARAAGTLSRRLGRGGGTSLPGKLLLRMRPGALAELGGALPRGVTVVSATNGKTTTSRLLADCARAAGWELVANTSGANLLSGLATALLEARGRRPAPDAGLFEVDEAALVEVTRQLHPRVLLLMNLFRDQLDRYGELEHLAAIWTTMVAGLPPDAVPVLNADDPAIAALGTGRPGVVTFGIDDPGMALPSLPHAADSTRCRVCEAPLTYTLVTIGHLGHWSCDACGAARPVPDVRATRVELRGAHGIAVTIATPEGEVAVELPLPGLHNAYNVTAATAGALAMGIPVEAIRRGLATTTAAFGRGERVVLDGRELVLLLAKNPTGANETVRTVLLDPEPPHLLIALNDRTADGHDVSWIWDVDYEPLLERAASLTLTGDRAYDLALRMRYAGVPDDAMTVEPDPERALDRAVAAVPDGGTLYVLPTYTAMLGLRETLVRRGAAEAFWRER
ncbi:MurT ligase domain-containing protein [Miltoncostaea oceani]|jgi:lipid II isoglutaminyl synthase (glutamine-hydrolysing)|uniref:MurT ligase domain-containing protein n=1 Tax=Miltoncostaea oceani TaxID=2843216 RepID=UPI001C3D9AA1|nr:MurT ligase domain-containing protein [Miltoncostaea oceani]